MNVYFRFGILFPVILVLFGASFVVWAGPCYIQTLTVPASNMGCSETFVGPLGLGCPSLNRLNPDNVPSASCGFRIDTKSIGVGTSGNESSGRMSQGSIARKCYTYVSCTFSGPHFDVALPISMYYLCSESVTYPGSAEHSSIEPTGGSCPEIGG